MVDHIKVYAFLNLIYKLPLYKAVQLYSWSHKVSQLSLEGDELGIK